MKQHNINIKQKIVPVVARIEVNYRREIILEDVIVNTKLEQANQSSLYQANFWQSIEVSKEGNSLVAVEARIQVVFIDSIERTLRTLQEFLKEASNNSDSIN